MELVEPGVVQVHRWRPGTGDLGSGRNLAIYAGSDGNRNRRTAICFCRGGIFAASLDVNIIDRTFGKYRLGSTMAIPDDRSRPVETMMASDAASKMLGIELVDYGPGWARTRMTIRDDMVNGHGICHGGMIFSLADTAFACACNSWGPVTVAAQCDIVFVASARVGDVLTAEARVRSRFGRNGIYDVAVELGDMLIAEFRGRSSQLREPHR